MYRRGTKLVLIAIAASAVVLPLASAGTAYADYAPSNGDVVGVGGDGFQYGMDFLFDGDAYGDAGYNQLGNKYKVVIFDATADANSRLSYGVTGGQPAETTCGPGTGSTVGTGNATGTNTGVPCVLNPTVVLRAGTQAVQRPGSSGGAYQALVQDDLAGHNTASSEVVNFASTSTVQSEPVGLPQKLDAVVAGDDTLEMLAAATTNAVPLSAAQLKTVYAADAGSCVTWDQVGGATTDRIVPLIPPPGSGVRSFFLAQINLTNPGTCAVVAEQDDPTALAAQSDPVDAIEPISQARLDLYVGDTSSGVAGGLPGGYFLDPSCAYLSGIAGCGTGSLSGGSWNPSAEAPEVAVLSGHASDGSAAFEATESLYIYFRHSDIASVTRFEPGLTQNWLNTIFYNPCQTGQPCSSSGRLIYGTGGPPYIDQAQGQAALEDAGITPVNTDLPSSYIPG